VFYFLPLALGLYYVMPRRGKHVTLTLLSSVSYGWANPYFVVLMKASTVINFICGLAIADRLGGKVLRVTFVFVLAIIHTCGAVAQEPILVDDFQRPDSLYHGEEWESLNPGLWKLEGKSLRRQFDNTGSRARDGLPLRLEVAFRPSDARFVRSFTPLRNDLAPRLEAYGGLSNTNRT